MSGIDYGQILDAVDFGAMVLDADARVLSWNRWLAEVSGISAEAAMGKALDELFPGVRTPAFDRNLKSVMTFGNFAYFSQKMHGTVLPFAARSDGAGRPMQQQCRMGPIREGNRIAAAFLLVQDVTEAVETERRLADEAMHDALTGARNRRYLDSRLEIEVERARRFGRSLSLAILDIDFFKALNDERGHAFGDRALQAISRAISAVVRRSDTFARYGGEEFCILMPECPLEQAGSLAERLRRAVESLELGLGPQVRTTISLGVAELKEGEGPVELLGRADAALYKSKEEGRNRTSLAG